MSNDATDSTFCDRIALIETGCKTVRRVDVETGNETIAPYPALADMVYMVCTLLARAYVGSDTRPMVCALHVVVLNPSN